ncbi:aminotransferase class I/II-fold pyridoxal phosphate-dependent enzyme [Mucilaginibacter sp. X4EP1]|uniref:aminotransferase class I/II-fold pyridoxal phosphate-dependent enzyme n=1 Tax=Mucilaginibacter sp. X4EP1 TaxID=2723092 RepID=UPI0021691880|nr:8-amino-7-oxononanoate synthase [Mucilaginibacter sp. X4EP1]MCS3814916.1 8-amino-7-oxononanoate synthase [Mucilaginibacter sp. X4EP1]
MGDIEKSIERKLEERQSAGNYRTLKPESTLIDFCSNDYLGFSRSSLLKTMIDEEITLHHTISNGSTGSRLLTGNSTYIEELEKQIAVTHNSEACLIFNSGYDANLGLFSSLPQRGDTIITDELIHASIIDGARLSYANRYTFKHNDLLSLEDKLKQARGNCYVVIESVYSMDGDTPPIDDILRLTEKYNAALIVDEAHALGLHKYGLIDETTSKRIFARVITFGKALGCHGAAVIGSNLLRNYLINFARSFIYTTAPTLHHFASIKMAYKLLSMANNQIAVLKNNIVFFKEQIGDGARSLLIDSDSAIQCLILNNNDKARELASLLQNSGLDVRPILSPTVPAGSERIRICLHAFNTESEIILLTEKINSFIND